MNQMNQPMGMPQQPGMGMGQPMVPQRTSRAPWIVLLVVVIIIIAVLAVLFRGKWTGSQNVKLSGYDAVFLTNGQVYFGKLSDARDQYVTLKDIYYLQVNQQLQPGQQGQSTQTQQQQQAASQNPQLSLVKLGNELHGPDDVMRINRDQILFYEDMKADGRVAQAIVEYQKNAAAAPAAGQPAAGSTAPAAGSPAPAQGTPAPAPAPTK